MVKVKFITIFFIAIYPRSNNVIFIPEFVILCQNLLYYEVKRMFKNGLLYTEEFQKYFSDTTFQFSQSLLGQK